MKSPETQIVVHAILFPSAHRRALQLTAIVELLEERGVLTLRDILKRMKEVRDRKKAG